MQRRILILDVHTNGHEAALALMKQQGWLATNCELVFCGSHHKLLQRLTQGPAYGVVPIHNSIAGQVTEVTKKLTEYRGLGYEFSDVNRLELQIDHCLLVPPHVTSASELDRVISHEKAIQQCGRYLDQIGIAPKKRGKRDSTGNAAQAVAKLNPRVKIGAIASKAAAKAYGLKILAENIQDVPDNKTTFVLLENKATVKQVIVGVIGINGRFGQILKNFFAGLGCTVIGADLNHPTGLTNIQVVEQSEVVIFSVPVQDTPAIIGSLVPHIRANQLVMDVTAVKQPAINAMLESPAQVVGLHPMFRPGVLFTGQTVVACPARLTMPDWKTWVVNMLAATGSKIKWSTAAAHDDYMTTMQILPHLSHLISALLITEANIPVKPGQDFTSPYYRLLFALMGRLASQGSGLYAAIMMDNPQTPVMIERRIAIEQRLAQMIRDRDRMSLEKMFMQVKKYFGPEITKEADELFLRVSSLLNTLCNQNWVTLEFGLTKIQPGLLERIAGVFSQQHLNLTEIHSFTPNGQRLQITIELEQSHTSDEVSRALQEFAAWSDPKVKILRPKNPLGYGQDDPD